MNNITQQVIEEFKLRIKLDGNDEDQNLARILNDSVNDLILKTGEYTIEESGVFKELVFERARYVYNDALEYFDTNFVSQITLLAIGNPKALDGGDGGGSTGPTIITYQDVVNALGYTPANVNDLNAFIARYNSEQMALNNRVTNNSNRIATLENQIGNVQVDLTPVNNRIAAVESVNNAQNNRLDSLEARPQVDVEPINNRLTAVEQVNTEQNARITNLENNGGNNNVDLTPLENRVTATENVNTTQNSRIDALEARPQTDLGPLTTRVDNLDARLTNEASIINDNVNRLNSLDTHVENEEIHKTSSTIRQESETPLRVEVVETLPTSNLENGRIVFNQTDNRIYYYDGSQWISTESNNGGGISEQEIFIAQTFSSANLPSTFQRGLHLIDIPSVVGNTSFNNCINILNSTLSINVSTSQTELKFYISIQSFDGVGSAKQTITGYINSNNNTRKRKAVEISRYSTNNTWGSWSVEVIPISYPGNPVGNLNGFNKSLVYDTLNMQFFINATTTDSYGQIWENLSTRTRRNSNLILNVERTTAIPSSERTPGRVFFNNPDGSLYYLNASGNPIKIQDDSVRQLETSPLRTEVVSSLPSSNLTNGRIVFNTADNTFRGYNGSEWV